MITESRKNLLDFSNRREKKTSDKSSDTEKGKTATTTPLATAYRSFKALIHEFSREWVDGIVFARFRLEASEDMNKHDKEVI